MRGPSGNQTDYPPDNPADFPLFVPHSHPPFILASPPPLPLPCLLSISEQGVQRGLPQPPPQGAGTAQLVIEPLPLDRPAVGMWCSAVQLSAALRCSSSPGAAPRVGVLGADDTQGVSRAAPPQADGELPGPRLPAVLDNYDVSSVHLFSDNSLFEL